MVGVQPQPEIVKLKVQLDIFPVLSVIVIVTGTVLLPIELIKVVVGIDCVTVYPQYS